MVLGAVVLGVAGIAQLQRVGLAAALSVDAAILRARPVRANPVEASSAQQGGRRSGAAICKRAMLLSCRAALQSSR